MPVVVHSELPGVIEVLRACWEPALLPPKATSTSSFPAELALQVSSSGSVAYGARALGQSASPGGVASLIEGYLLTQMRLDNRNSFLLHAGAVVFGDLLVLLLGQPGAGKSTFTREALRLGGSYLTDDSLVCEQGNFRGLARTVHFDAVLETELPQLPSYFRDCDLDSSRFSDREGRTWVVPLWRAEFPTLANFRAEAGKVMVLQIEHGPVNDTFELSALERAAALLGASLSAGSPDFRVVPEGPTFHVAWNEDPAGILKRALARIQASRSSQ